MGKKFNITGTCIPDKHYMVDTSNKIEKILKLIDNEEYFIINRPRQYGKTTTLYLLEKKLNNIEEYLPIRISFESIDAESYGEAKKFLRSMMRQVRNYFRFSFNKSVYEFIKKIENKINTMNEFSDFITDLVEFTEKKVVLIIDEVDKSSNNQLFLDFLGMLRSKY
ncbi:AAA family ATPase, partial [Parabacteroides distasonis]|nr:AAA family ATPase [Parabacteroides distasonis]